jgi:hypothetical protein
MEIDVLVPATLETLSHYLHERERIRLAKDRGELRSSWTEDKILQTFKFTNVLRENDWTTQQLLHGWYGPNQDAPLEYLLMAAGVARYFGTWEFCNAVGFGAASVFDKEHIRTLAQSRLNGKPKRPVFTSAYVITNGGISDAKYNVVLDHYLTPLHRCSVDLARLGSDTGSFERMGRQMQTLPGFGGTGFMMKEVMSDFILATKGRIEWKDLYTWSPVGPGARRGINRLHGRPADSRLNDASALRELREIAEALAPMLESWMPQFGEAYDLHAVQFAMCEFDKYMRAKTGEGQPKNNYNPRT